MAAMRCALATDVCRVLVQVIATVSRCRDRAHPPRSSHHAVLARPAALVPRGARPAALVPRPRSSHASMIRPRAQSGPAPRGCCTGTSVACTVRLHVLSVVYVRASLAPTIKSSLF